MSDEKMTPNWTNPSIGASSNNENYSKEIDNLRKEVNELKEEISRLTGEEVKPTEPVVVETPKNDNIEMPFDSPFSEAVSESTETTEEPINEETVKDILDTVKEDVKEEPAEETPITPSFDDLLVDEKKEKVSVVVNRYNSDIEATTKGKGAKYISLTEAEHNKLLSGKINE